MRSVLFAILMQLVGATAWALGCGCDRVVPVPGQYSITGPDFSDTVTVEVGTGPDGTCASAIEIVHPRASASLTCQGGGYAGQIHFMKQPMQFHGEWVAGWGGGLRLGTHFEGLIQRPGMIASIPGEPFTPNFTLELIAPAGPRAPACMCEEVKSWIEHSKRKRDVYADLALIEHAVDSKLPGVSAEFPAWPDGSVVGAYQPTFSSSYREKTGTFFNSIDPVEKTHADQVKAAATNSVTCDITPASSRTDKGQCRSHAVLSAIWAHEEVHSNRCEAIKRDASDAAAYLYWSNHPPNHALDEREAYQTVIDRLEPWYAENCR